jgi:hypothetical protein
MLYIHTYIHTYIHSYKYTSAMKRYRQTTIHTNVDVPRRKLMKEEFQLNGILSMNDDCIGVIMGYLGPGETHRISKTHPIIERISLQDFIWKGVYEDVKNHYVGRRIYSVETTESLDEAKTKHDKALNNLYDFNIDIYTKNPSPQYHIFRRNFVKSNRISLGLKQSLDFINALRETYILDRLKHYASQPDSEIWFDNHRDRAMYIMKKHCGKCDKTFLNENDIKSCCDYGKSCKDPNCMITLLCTSCTCKNKCNVCGFYVIDNDDDDDLIDPSDEFVYCSCCSTGLHMECNGIEEEHRYETLCDACILYEY